jgi:hypothetical protein
MSDPGHDKPGRELAMAPIPLDTLRPTPSSVLTLLRPDWTDLIVAIFAVAIPIFVWLSCIHCASLNHIFTFWDCGHYLLSYGPLSHGNITDPYPARIGRPREHCVSPFRLHRLIVRTFVLLAAGHWRLGQLIYVLFCSVAVGLLFKRFLIAYGFARSALRLTLLLTFFPLRFVFFRSLPTFDALYFVSILIALILYRLGHPWLLAAALVFASLLRLEAIFLFVGFAICYALIREWPHAVALGAVGVLVVVYVNVFVPDWRDGVIPDAISRGDHHEREFVHTRPFGFFFLVRGDIVHLRQLHTLQMILIPPIFASALLLFQSVPLAVFGFAYVLAVSFIQSQDLNRFAIPVHAITILAGCHFFLSQKVVTFIIVLAAPCVLASELYYCGQQISSRQVLSSFHSALSS